MIINLFSPDLKAMLLDLV